MNLNAGLGHQTCSGPKWAPPRLDDQRERFAYIPIHTDFQNFWVQEAFGEPLPALRNPAPDRSDVESEMHDVALLNDVAPALQPQLARLLGARLPAQRHKIVV